jgi:hypothetical protein
MVRRSKGCVEGVRYRDVWPFEVLANISSTRLRFVSRCQCIGDIGHKNLPRVSAIIRHPRKAVWLWEFVGVLGWVGVMAVREKRATIASPVTTFRRALAVGTSHVRSEAVDTLRFPHPRPGQTFGRNTDGQYLRAGRCS